MKKTLVILALFAAFGAQAQDSNSTSNSGSQSGSTSTSGATAVGNQNASQSDSASASRAASGSVSGAVGNAITVNLPAAQTGPNAGVQSLSSDGIATTRLQDVVSGGTNSTMATTATQNSTGTSTNTNTNRNTDNINYSGTIDNKSSGGTYNIIDTRVSGSQTVRSAPAIAMSGPASGPCTGVSGGVAGSGIGWGFGVNMSAVMLDCRLRENTRVLGMGMQSLDGAANPQEKGETLVMFMDAMRNLAAYNNTLYQAEKNK